MISLLRAVATFILQLFIFAVLPLSVLFLLYKQDMISTNSLLIGCCISTFLAFVVIVYSVRDIYKSYVFSYNLKQSINDFQVLFREEYELLFSKLVVENDVSEEFLILAEKNWQKLYEVSTEIQNSTSYLKYRKFSQMQEVSYFVRSKLSMIIHSIEIHDKDFFTYHFSELVQFCKKSF